MPIMEKCPDCWVYMTQKIKYGIDGNPYVEYTCPKCGKKISALKPTTVDNKTIFKPKNILYDNKTKLRNED